MINSENKYGAEITYKQKGLAQKHLTINKIKEKFKDLEDCSEFKSYDSFDCIDPNGEIARVYLFLKDGNLWVNGAYRTKVFRNPDNLYCFLNRSKRVRKITLAYFKP